VSLAALNSFSLLRQAWTVLSLRSACWFLTFFQQQASNLSLTSVVNATPLPLGPLLITGRPYRLAHPNTAGRHSSPLRSIAKVFAQHDLSTSFTTLITKVFARHDLSTSFTTLITKVSAQHEQPGIGTPR
jgi:hypothetical protein